MPERDGYIPGVPCWIDTSQPDPEAAVAFYSGLFGWEFEDVMPPGSHGKYFIARIRGGDVAAVGSLPEGAPPRAMWNTYVWVESADETAAKVRDAGGTRADGAVRRHGRGPHGGVRRSRGRGVLRLAGEASTRAREVVNEHGSLNFNGLNTRDAEAAKSFYGAVFGWETLGLAGGARDVDAARLRRPPRARQPRPARADGRDRRAPGVRGRRRGVNPIPDDQPDVPRALERHVRGRRRRRDRREGDRARRQGARRRRSTRRGCG